MKEVWLRKIQK